MPDDISGFMEEFKALERGKKMSDTLNKAAAIFLSNNADKFEDIMSSGMGLIADMADLDRLNVWRNHMEPDGLHVSQIYRWDRESGGTTKPTSDFADIAYADFAPRWEKLFLNNETINSPVRLIPEEKLLRKYDAVSVFVIPIFIKGNFWGFMLFSDTRNERYFDEDCIGMLRSAASLCVNSIIRNESDLAITKATKFYQAIIKSAPFGLTLFDENISIIDCNDEILNMLDTNRRDYISNFYSFSPEYQPDGEKSIEKALRTMKHVIKSEETVLIEWEHLSSKGEKVPCELKVTFIEQDGEFTGLAFAYDLRKIKKMETEIDRAARINRSILESMPIGMAFFDGTPRVTDCNTALMKMFDAPKEQIINRYYEDFSPEFLPDGKNALDEAYKNTNRAIDGEIMRFEWPHQTAKGDPVPCDVTLIRVKDENEFIGLGFLYDLRDYKKLTGELESALKHARAASEAKGYFLSNMSHEMRTPLNTIMGMAS
ncbi:MAG: PAS domain-containing protein, partial [Treponema sp.]|nr:PAS domain-containing protein [Treponema sp.]